MTEQPKAETPFFLVWNPEGRSPTYRHATIGEATKEAERLAAKHPGTFFVLAVVGSARMTTLESATFPFDREAEETRAPHPFCRDIDDDVPF